jgi:hypothetical protein
MKNKLKWIVLPAIIMVAWIADHFFANGDYLRLLSGWSYLGWTSIFLVYLWVFKSFRIAFANIFVTSIIQDILLNTYRDYVAGIPFHIHIGGADTIYGKMFAPLAKSICGINSGYLLMGSLAIILYVLPIIIKRFRKRKNT